MSLTVNLLNNPVNPHSNKNLKNLFVEHPILSELLELCQRRENAPSQEQKEQIDKVFYRQQFVGKIKKLIFSLDEPLEVVKFFLETLVCLDKCPLAEHFACNQLPISVREEGLKFLLRFLLKIDVQFSSHGSFDEIRDFILQEAFYENIANLDKARQLAALIRDPLIRFQVYEQLLLLFAKEKKIQLLCAYGLSFPNLHYCLPNALHIFLKKGGTVNEIVQNLLHSPHMEEVLKGLATSLLPTPQRKIAIRVAQHIADPNFRTGIVNEVLDR